MRQGVSSDSDEQVGSSWQETDNLRNIVESDDGVQRDKEDV